MAHTLTAITQRKAQPADEAQSIIMKAGNTDAQPDSEKVSGRVRSLVRWFLNSEIKFKTKTMTVIPPRKKHPRKAKQYHIPADGKPRLIAGDAYDPAEDFDVLE